ncbi:hypothetical protein K435DRAFT_811850 [Dendrothele bispora CBS 962.96]|uniref:Uncharacterized protein n=1 Tax=Dendrothele bispora (strain CBS 962.96) TaxID=1314807 RepID=A0A4S8KR12_DENBC|nr:hypothetical protein K435DRAFT_811850 [Dendrothele bispora CBS 962.96]
MYLLSRYRRKKYLPRRRQKTEGRDKEREERGQEQLVVQRQGKEHVIATLQLVLTPFPLVAVPQPSALSPPALSSLFSSCPLVACPFLVIMISKNEITTLKLTTRKTGSTENRYFLPGSDEEDYTWGAGDEEEGGEKRTHKEEDHWEDEDLLEVWREEDHPPTFVDYLLERYTKRPSTPPLTGDDALSNVVLRSVLLSTDKAAPDARAIPPWEGSQWY